MYVAVFPLQHIAALIAGILILIMPKLLNYLVAVYLILVGIIGIAHYIMSNKSETKKNAVR